MWYAWQATKSVTKGVFKNGAPSLKLIRDGNVEGNACIMQQIEKYKSLENTMITMSFWARSIGGATSFVYNVGSGFTEQALSIAWQKYELTCIFTYDESLPWHRGVAIFTRGGDGCGVEIAQVKLEPGDIATKFMPQDYGITLLKCQRYYQRISIPTFNNNFVWIDNAGIVGFTLPMPNMRLTSPTCKILGTAEAQLRFSNGTVISNVPLSQDTGYRVGLVYYNFKKDNTSLPVGACAYVITGGFAEIELMAEL